MATATRTEARRAVQRMWVAGTLGVFFTTVLRNLPVHLHQVSSTPNWIYTLDLFVRYGYLLWLLVYFFISNFRIDQSEHEKDLQFDVIQSVVSLSALVALDFVVPGQGIPIGRFWWAVTVANATIIVIAGLAFKWFPDANLKAPRVAGMGLAAISLIVAWLPFSPVVTLLGVIILECALLVVLFIYVYKRWPANESAVRS